MTLEDQEICMNTHRTSEEFATQAVRKELDGEYPDHHNSQRIAYPCGANGAVSEMN